MRVAFTTFSPIAKSAKVPRPLVPLNHNMVTYTDADIGEDDGSSVMRKIDQTENDLKFCYHRLETLERNLQFRPMTIEEREVMEKDVEQLRNILKVQEDNLKKLRGENRTSMIFAVILLIGTFLFYGLYSMIFRKPTF